MRREDYDGFWADGGGYVGADKLELGVDWVVGVFEDCWAEREWG